MPARLAALAAAVTLAATACSGGGRDAAPGDPPPAATTTTGRATPPPDLPRTTAALGDSITRAFLACDGLADCPAGSWATGGLDELDSHAQRVEALAGRPVTAHNLAVSGARVSGLATQVEAAIRARPDYVTVLIGANDGCAGSEEAMTPVAEYAAAFDTALARLVRGLPRARVLVVSIPDLLRLWEVGRGDAGVRETWQRYSICRSMLADPTDTGAAADARRGRVRDRVAAYNAAMAASCAKHRGCRWDGNAVFDYDFTLAEVSPRDYWHPSREGQRALAEVSWAAGFWP